MHTGRFEAFAQVVGSGGSVGLASTDGEHVLPSDEVDAEGDAPPPNLGALAVVSQEELGWEHLVAEARRLGRDVRFEALSDEEVVARVASGAAELAAATCRWLELVGELVVRGTWAEQGAKTPGAWLSWRVGVAPSTAREHVRVALRLRELPQIRARFAAGTLSYSKVRALTRITSDASQEPLLVGWADDATAAQLERIASRARSAQRLREDVDPSSDPDIGWSTRRHADGTMSVTVRAPDEVVAALLDDVERLAVVTVADREGEHDGGGDTADDRPPVRVSPTDRVEALAAACAVAAAADTPVDTTGLDRHTLVLHAEVHDLVDDVGHEVVAVRDDHHRVGGMPRTTLRRLACDAGIVLAVHGTVDARSGPSDLGWRS